MSELCMGKRRIWPTPDARDAQPEGLEGGLRRWQKWSSWGLQTAAMMDNTPPVPPVSRQLTFFAEAFPASPTPSLADAAAAPTSATSGPSSPDSFAKLDPDGCWRKTSQGYCQVTLDGSLDEFSETWPRAGMTRNGTAYLLSPLAPLTDATASGLWPTPCAQEDNKSPAAHLAMKARMVGGPRSTITSLNVMVKATARGLWPTPQPRSQGWHGAELPQRAGECAAGTSGPSVPDTQSHRWASEGERATAGYFDGLRQLRERCSHWESEPDVGRVAHGVPARVDRLRGLGNAIVPQIAEWLGRRLMAVA